MALILVWTMHMLFAMSICKDNQRGEDSIFIQIAYTYLSLNEDKSSVEILINVEIEENKTNKISSSVKKAVRTKVGKYVESKDPEYTIHKYAGFNLKEFKGYRVNFIFMDEE